MYISTVAVSLCLFLAFSVNLHAQTPVECSDIVDSLREFQSEVRTTGPVPGTGDTMNYLVVGNPFVNEAIVFIPGTNSIIPDWPVQLFTNTSSSPQLKNKYPNADNSLCSDYVLIFIDFPGVAGSTLSSKLSFESVSKDISYAIQSAELEFGLAIDTVHVYGWSLGSLTALRFAESNPDSLPLGTLFLSGTKPGGGADGNISGCVGQAWNLLETDKNAELEQTIVRLMFPYQDQKPYNGKTDRCSSINETTFKPNVTLSGCSLKNNCMTTPCDAEEMCGRVVESFVSNRAQGSKWAGGVPANVYNEQRGLDKSYDTCSCFPGDEKCSCPSFSFSTTAKDGGPCMCNKINPNHAVCFTLFSSNFGCLQLSNARDMVVFNAKEDIFIQWLYGFYLTTGYNFPFQNYATFINYDIDQGLQAGHGLPLQAPSWMQDKMYDHLQGNSIGDIHDQLFSDSENGFPNIALLISNVPALNLIGLIILAGILGVIALIAIRKPYRNQ